MIASIMVSCGSTEARDRRIEEHKAAYTCLSDSVHHDHYMLSDKSKSILAKMNVYMDNDTIPHSTMLTEFNGASCANKQIMYYRYVYNHKRGE